MTARTLRRIAIFGAPVGLGPLRIFIATWLAWLIYIGLRLGGVGLSAERPKRTDA